MAKFKKFVPKEKDKKEILAMFKSGLPMRRMQAQTKYTSNMINVTRRAIVEEGRITEAEIKEAYEKYMVAHPPAQGLNGEKARDKGGNREKSEKRNARKREKIERTIQMIKNGACQSEIANELKVSAKTVRVYIDILISEGRISSDEIKVGNNTNSAIDRTSPEYLKRREEIISLIKQGYKNWAIRKKLGVDNVFEYQRYLDDIFDKGFVTRKEAKEAQKKKYEEDLDFIANSINEGLTLDQIRGYLPHISYNGITAYKNELVKRGLITEEQVEQNRIRAVKNSMKKDDAMSADQQYAFVIEKVKAGYPPLEIVASDKTHSITMHVALYLKRKAIAEGIITQEEAEKAMKEREMLLREPILIELGEYVKRGYNLKEISIIVEHSVQYVTNLRKEYEEKFGWFSDEKLKIFYEGRIKRVDENGIDDLPLSEQKVEKIRIKKETERRRDKKRKQKELIKQRKQKEKKKEEVKQLDINMLRYYIEKGFLNEEIAEIMYTSVTQLVAIKRKLKENDEWYTDEQLKEFKEQRAKRETKKRAEQHRKVREQQVEEFGKLMRKGYKASEIVMILGCSETIVTELESDWIRKYGVISNEDLKRFYRKRVERVEKLGIDNLSDIEKEIEKIRLEKSSLSKDEVLNKVGEYIRKGYRVYEIGFLLGVNRSIASELIKEYVNKYGGFSKDELKQFYNERKKRVQEYGIENLSPRQRELEKRRFKRRDKIQADSEVLKEIKEKSKERLVEQEREENLKIQKLRIYIEQGFYDDEIISLMNCTLDDLQSLILTAQRKGQWFTQSEIDTYSNKRKEADIKQKIIDDANAKQEEKERARKFNKMILEYKRIERKSIREDEKESDGIENVSIENRKKFLEMTVEMVKMDYQLEEDEISLIINTLYLHPNLGTKDIIKILVSNAYKQGGFAYMKNVLNELTFAFHGSRTYVAIIQYREWAEQQELILTIKKLHNEGLSDNQIAEKVKKTTAEVILLHRSFEKNSAFKKNPFDDGPGGENR